MQKNNFYCYKNNPSDIEIILSINFSLLEDLIRWHDIPAIEEYQKFKKYTMELYGWNQKDYNLNFGYYKTKNDKNKNPS